MCSIQVSHQGAKTGCASFVNVYLYEMTLSCITQRPPQRQGGFLLIPPSYVSPNHP